MIHEQNTKLVNAVRPGAIVNGAAYTGQVIDTDGFDYARIVVQLGALDIAFTVLKLTECDTSGGSYTDITGAIYGTSNNIAGSASALPVDTDDNDLFVIDVNMKGRKRYLKLAATIDTGVAGGYLSALAILSKAKTNVTTAADAGCNDILRVA